MKKLMFFIKHKILNIHKEIVFVDSECICGMKFIDDDFSWKYSLFNRISYLKALFREYRSLGKDIEVYRKQIRVCKKRGNWDELVRTRVINAREIKRCEEKRDELLGKVFVKGEKEVRKTFFLID